MDEVLTLCLCWRLARKDGAVLCVTEHDRALEVDGVIYQPGASVEGVRFVSSLSLKPDQAVAGGALAHEAISEEDLEAGKWNGARVDVIRADWRSGAKVSHVWSGVFSEVRLTCGRFEVELVSLKEALERPVGRVYSRRCDAVLGDARCGVDMAAHEGAVCDQRFETCTARFANGENFRGFPNMPEPDAVLKGPAASGNDGGKR